MSIFNFVMDEVADVVTQIVNEVSKIEDVRDGLQSAASSVIGVEWTGEGANAFYDEVGSRLMPEIAALIASIGGFQLNLSKAQDRVVQGDDDGVKAINNLASIYEEIKI